MYMYMCIYINMTYVEHQRVWRKTPKRKKARRELNTNVYLYTMAFIAKKWCVVWSVCDGLAWTCTVACAVHDARVNVCIRHSLFNRGYKCIGCVYAFVHL